MKPYKDQVIHGGRQVSKIKALLTSNYNTTVHSDISKLTTLEGMALQAIKKNDISQIRELIGIEAYLDNNDITSRVECPVVENLVSINMKKKKPKKTDK